MRSCTRAFPASRTGRVVLPLGQQGWASSEQPGKHCCWCRAKGSSEKSGVCWVTFSSYNSLGALCALYYCSTLVKELCLSLKQSGIERKQLKGRFLFSISLTSGLSRWSFLSLMRTDRNVIFRLWMLLLMMPAEQSWSSSCKGVVLWPDPALLVCCPSSRRWLLCCCQAWAK